MPQLTEHKYNQSTCIRFTAWTSAPLLSAIVYIYYSKKTKHSLDPEAMAYKFHLLAHGSMPAELKMTTCYGWASAWWLLVGQV